MESILKFIGSGSAFNTELGNTAAYYKQDDKLLLIDCGSDTFSRIMKLGILEDVKSVCILITHNHPDHIGSLGDLIFYLYYIKNITPIIFTMDLNLTIILKMMGVPDNMYTIEFGKNDPTYIIYGFITINPIKTFHFNDMISYGYRMIINEYTGTHERYDIYYSGDSNKIPENILTNCGTFTHIYQDVCNMAYENNPHLSYSKLKDIIPPCNRNKFFCMHLDKGAVKIKSDIINDGFNVVENESITEREPNCKDIKKKETIAIYPGTFDPITNGHMNLIEKASKMYDTVIVAIMKNSKKKPLLMDIERNALIEKCISKFNNVTCLVWEGMLVDLAESTGATAIIRGARSVTDFDYELQIAMINKSLNKNIETVLLIPDAEVQHISSSLVKELADYKKNISCLVPKEVIGDINAMLYSRLHMKRD